MRRAGHTRWEHTAGRAPARAHIHTHWAPAPYLSHVLHDEAVLADLLQRADAPATPVIRAEDAEVIANALLYHAVGAVIAAAAARVALVDGQPRTQPHLTLVIVGKLVQGRPRAAASGRGPQTVLALTAHSHLVEGDALPHTVLVDVYESPWGAIQVHLVLHGDASQVAALGIELLLPAPERPPLLGLLYQVVGQAWVQVPGGLRPVVPPEQLPL